MNAISRTTRPVRRQVIRLSVGFGLAASLAGGFAVPAFAADTITQAVTGASLSATVANVAVANAVAYSHAAQTPTGTMVLTADDSRGSGAGWNVSILTGNFAYAGDSLNGLAIPAVNFVITTAGTPAMTAGQATDTTGGPKAGVGGSLDAARKVILANANFGAGTYTQDLSISLLIPAQSRAGTYTGTLTVTEASGPGA
jgi:hypothetical protein